MKWINRICIIICLLICGLALTYKLIMIRIPLGHVGVLTQQYAIMGDKGVVDQDFAPGWHRDFGPIHNWVLFDTTVQTIEMSKNPKLENTPSSLFGNKESPSVMLGEKDDVQLKSSDGYSISLDITLKFKIQPGAAHLLYQDSGGNDNYKRIVRNLALNTFREVFGGMKTEDFYNPEIRNVSAEEVLTNLASKLEPRYVELIDVLIRDIAFDPQYEGKILQKKLADQEVEVNKSESLAAEKRGETLRINAEADAMVKVIGKERDGEVLKMKAEAQRKVAEITSKAEKEAAQITADADLFAAQTIAKGTQLVKEAEAESERLKAEAIMGEGGANLVALEAVKQINLSDMTVSTLTTDFLNINSMMELLGTRSGNLNSAKDQ